MNFKSKLLSLGAAALLSLSMSIGVASAATSTSTGASVILETGVCAITPQQSSVDFGTWEYDGQAQMWLPDNFVDPLTTPFPEATLNWTVVEGNPAGCTINTNFFGLQNGNSLIGLENFLAGVWMGENPNPGPWAQNIFGPGLGVVSPGVPTGAASVWLQLHDVPDDFMPGVYSGAIATTVQNTQ